MTRPSIVVLAIRLEEGGAKNNGQVVQVHLIHVRKALDAVEVINKGLVEWPC
uniref:Uncharacterized protein n=1 Tax=Anguilla anguilla TaxID=7936 RepID=A0A0E9V2A3_ANGAN